MKIKFALIFLIFPVFLSATLQVPLATNMCISLDKPIASDVSGTGSLTALNDGWESTRWYADAPFFVSMRLDATNETADHLLLHFKADSTSQWDSVDNSLNIFELSWSDDSTDGLDGTWTTLLYLTNIRKDNVYAFSNCRPVWLRVNEYSSQQVSLARLDIYRSAPPGRRLDYWVWLGASITQQSMGPFNTHWGGNTFFTDRIRTLYPDYYPISVNYGFGGENAQNGFIRMTNVIFAEHPEATFIPFHHGGNNVSPYRPYPGGANVLGIAISNIINHATNAGYIPVPSRLTFRNYSDVDYPIDPASENNGSLPYNLNIHDVAIAGLTPWAVNPSTGVAWADHYTWFRDHQLQLYDGIHLDGLGRDAFNEHFVLAASSAIYAPRTGFFHSNLAVTPFAVSNDSPAVITLQLETWMTNGASISSVQADLSDAGLGTISLLPAGGSLYTNSITIPAALKGGYKFFSVTAESDNGNTLLRRAQLNIIDNNPPATPVITNITADGAGTVYTRWSYSLDESGIVQYYLASGTTSGIYDTTNDILKSAMFAYTYGHSPGTTYYYTIWSVDIWGNFSAVVETNVTIPGGPPPVTNPQPPPPADIPDGLYPNPAETGGEITFGGYDDKLPVVIMSITGEKIWQGTTDDTWDLHNSYGNPLIPGVYLYIIYLEDGFNIRERGKLIIR